MKHPDPNQPLLSGLLTHVDRLHTPAAISLDAELAERAYLARQLVLCTLPHSDPGSIDSWVRTSNNLQLVITRTQIDNTGKLIGYPYGSIPRLILFWVNTEAVRTQSRRLNLGHTLSDFMRELGMDPRNGTGPRSDSTRLKNQLTRLFASSITFQQHVTGRAHNGQMFRFVNMQIASEGELWWHPHNPAQGQLWGSWILLGERFFEAITKAPVPVDLRILREIKASPLALDLYAWLTYTAFRAHQGGTNIDVSWADLAAQIGSEYATVKEFGRKCRAALQKIQGLYKGADVYLVPGGVRVRPTSTPSVLPERGRQRGR